eukprot:7869489-Pyramimonas_sp.AAC.1
MEYREKHLEARDTFWQVCRRAVGQVPARASLVITLNANAHVPPTLPWVGFAGVRRTGPAINGN